MLSTISAVTETLWIGLGYSGSCVTVSTPGIWPSTVKFTGDELEAKPSLSVAEMKN